MLLSLFLFLLSSLGVHGFFQQVGSLNLTSGENYVYASAISSAGDYAYFIAEAIPGYVVKVALNNFTRVGSSVLKCMTKSYGSVQTYSSTFSGVIAPSGDFVYVGTKTAPARILKIRLDDLTVNDTITLGGEDYNLNAAVMSPLGDYAYFAPGSSARIIKLDLETFQVNEALQLGDGETSPSTGFIHGDYLYWGLDTQPGKVAKINLTNFTEEANTLELQEGEDMLYSAVVAGDYGYFGTHTNPGIIVKVDLITFTRVDNLTLEEGMGYLDSAAVSPDGDYAYFATNVDDLGVGTGIVVKIDLENFTMVDYIVLGPPVTTAVISPFNDYAYFAIATIPATIVRIGLRNGTQFVTTAEATTAQATTAEVTTAKLTTAELTTAELTTAQITTANPTTAPATTLPLTTSTPTTSPTIDEPTASSSTGSNVDVTSGESSSELEPYVIITISLSLALVLSVAVVAAVIFLYKRRTEKKSTEDTVMKPQWKKLEGLTIGEKLGGGNFGDVYKGDWKGTPVAVKHLRDEEHIKDFEHEVTMLSKLNHPHIVRYLGIHKDDEGKLYIVTEFMAKGSLASVIDSEYKSIQTSDLIRIAKQAATGMVYLEEEKIIHRDIALRNFLVCQLDNEPYHVKVSDFGLSRVMDDDYYKANKVSLPVRWSAPEAFKYGRFTRKSDVWSFGVMLWELFSRGERPYFKYTNEQTMEKVLDGYRLEKPDECPDEIYEMMKRCWSEDPEIRPTFKEILEIIETVWKKEVGVDVEEPSSKHSRLNNKKVSVYEYALTP